MYCSPSSADDCATMRTARFAAFDVLLPAGPRDHGQPASDASAGRTLSGAALFRKQQYVGFCLCCFVGLSQVLLLPK